MNTTSGDCNTGTNVVGDKVKIVFYKQKHWWWGCFWGIVTGVLTSYIASWLFKWTS
jgi:hypothetical protein